MTQIAVNDEERNMLILRHQDDARRFAKSLLRSWKQFIEADELCSTTDLALCEAAATFRPDLGTAFPTHLYYHVKGRIVRVIVKRRQVRLPMQSLEDMPAALVESLSIRESERDLCTEETLVADSLCLRPDEALIRKQVIQLSATLPNRLTGLEREVIIAIYFQGEAVGALAARLNYSRVHISRIRASAIRRLRKSLID